MHDTPPPNTPSPTGFNRLFGGIQDSPGCTSCRPNPIQAANRLCQRVLAAVALTAVILAGLVLASFGDPAAGQPSTAAAGKAVIEQAPTGEAVQLTKGETHDDFPAAVATKEGTVWCAYVAYQQGNPVDSHETNAGRFEGLRTRGNGDQIKLMRCLGGKWQPAIDVTGPGNDVWRPTVALDGTGGVWVFWAQQVQSNWDLFGRSVDPQTQTLGPLLRLTSDAEADINVVAVGNAQGKGVWLAWQARRNGNFDVHLARLEERELLEEQRVSNSPANDWNPAIAADAHGAIYVAWDTYDQGNYDVYLRQMTNGRLAAAIPVAASARFEARPSVAFDTAGRIWVAFEDAAPNWGKDFGSRLVGNGTPFYMERNILVRCVTPTGLQAVAEPRAPETFTHYDDTTYKPSMKHRISMPRLACDNSGAVWLAYRRHPLSATAEGERWVGYARRLEGKAWSAEIALPQSDNLIDNRPALLPYSDGGLLAIYSTDGRKAGSQSAKTCRVNAVVLTAAAPANEPVFVGTDARAGGEDVPVHPDETREVGRIRNYTIGAGGKSYHLLRGDFHRHSEMSAHRDWDGPLEEMWRYGLDVAALDWIGPTDHDYALNHEYMWWLTQKQLDLYFSPARFLTMYTYERSLPYPSGHRNVMFAERGIRPLPVMNGKELRFGTPEKGAPDIQNLYRYLKFFGGICSSHTSATSMGTDWRDNDPEVEPVVEIFQGHRQNYEEPKGPLAARDAADSIQGYEPAGFVWQALKRGKRLGFQSSSDHVSTHISYAVVLAEEPTREGLIAAFKKRHCYAANDNIILDVQCAGHIMGDEFNTTQPPRLDVIVQGTAAVHQIDIVRQVGDEMPTYVYNFDPGHAEARFQWTDAAARKGAVSMYYVRIQQVDGRMAWASPMWIHYE